MDESRGQWILQTWTPRLDAPGPRAAKAPCKYAAYLPEPIAEWTPTVEGPTAAKLAEAEAAVVAVAQHTKHAGLALLSHLLLRTEAIASSRIEGINLDARTFLQAEARQDSGRRVSAAQSEVLRNVEALHTTLMATIATETLERASITDIHRSLFTGSGLESAGGVIRTSQNWIGGNDYNPCGADFVPPPPDELDRLLDDLVAFLDRADLGPVMHSAIAHVQFETLHPFPDGNGRTGRALIQLLLQRGMDIGDLIIPVSLVFARGRERYIHYLMRFREGAVDDYLSHFATSLTIAAIATQTFLHRLEDIHSEWRSQLAGTRSDSAAWKLLDILPVTPIVTLPTAIASTGRSRGAVNMALALLEDRGILTPISVAARQRTWEATDLLDALIELETSIASPS